jgi:hypothetical protein
MEEPVQVGLLFPRSGQKIVVCVPRLLAQRMHGGAAGGCMVEVESRPGPTESGKSESGPTKQ